MRANTSASQACGVDAVELGRLVGVKQTADRRRPVRVGLRCDAHRQDARDVQRLLRRRHRATDRNKSKVS
jgi:hypothetical protein